MHTEKFQQIKKINASNILKTKERVRISVKIHTLKKHQFVILFNRKK